MKIYRILESLIKKIPVNISDSNNNNLFHLILKETKKQEYEQWYSQKS